MKGLAYNPSAIKEEDIDVWTSHAVAPGGLRGAFEHFRAFPLDAEQNKETAKSKITTPVRALGGDIYPALVVMFLVTSRLVLYSHWLQM